MRTILSFAGFVNRWHEGSWRALLLQYTARFDGLRAFRRVDSSIPVQHSGTTAPFRVLYMKRLLVLGMVGCGDPVTGLMENSRPFPHQIYIRKDDAGDVVEVSLHLAKITDAGLVHLKGLTNLPTLWLDDTLVSPAGVAELQKALPNCKTKK